MDFSGIIEKCFLELSFYDVPYYYKYVDSYLRFKRHFFIAKQKSSVNFVNYNEITTLKIK